MDRITLSAGDSPESSAEPTYQFALARHGKNISWPGRSICTLLRLFHYSTVTTSREPSKLTSRLSAGSLRHFGRHCPSVLLPHRLPYRQQNLSTPQGADRRLLARCARSFTGIGTGSDGAAD